MGRTCGRGGRSSGDASARGGGEGGDGRYAGQRSSGCFPPGARVMRDVAPDASQLGTMADDAVPVPRLPLESWIYLAADPESGLCLPCPDHLTERQARTSHEG